MRRTILFIGSLLVPVAAFALDYERSAETYRDEARFSTAESAGISILTNLGAVGGYPDGTFQPGKTVNRAEFLKIVFLSNPSVVAVDDDADDCFPDVRASDWFSSYVCLAKRRGDVAGYPDGLFRPANTVNYAEALKMLVEIYDLDLPEPAANERWAWYTAYLRAAEDEGLDLTTVDPAALLTRGQMARLAASFRANDEGELDTYRDFEHGQTPQSASSSSRSSSSSSRSSSLSSFSSSTSSTSQASSASQTSSTAVSTFILIGQTSRLLADAVFTNNDEDMYVKSAFVRLEQNMDGIDKLLLIDPNGSVVAELSRRGTDDDTEKEWEGAVTNSGAYKVTKGQQARFGLKARMRTVANGGRSNELFEIDTWRVRFQGATTGVFTEPGLANAHLPRHQVALGAFTAVRNVFASSITVAPGPSKLIGTFAFEGVTTTGALLQVREFNFNLETTGVNATNIRIGGSSPVQQQSCGTEQGTTTVTCGLIPEGMGMYSGTPPQLSIYADIAFQSNQTAGSLRVVPQSHGAIGSFGSLRWSDGAAVFSWIEATGPMEAGPLVTVSN